jgi:hypothetical protein
MKSLAIALAAAVALSGLAGCGSTVAAYQPLDPEAVRASGYSQVRLQPDRWRVTYLGDGRQSRETVETDLLRRAAELTLAQGYDGFTAADQTLSHPETLRPPKAPTEGWQPNWRYFGEGFGWLDWNPERQDPLWAQHEAARVIKRYEASEEIVMHRGPSPQGGGQFDARDVLCRLPSTSNRRCAEEPVT